MARRRWLTEDRRSALLFVVGVGLGVYEVIVRQGPERPFVLAFIAALVGVPFVGELLLSRPESRDDEAP